MGRTYNELASTRRDISRELAKNDWKNKLFPDGAWAGCWGNGTGWADSAGKALIFPIGQQVVSSYSRRPFFGFYEAESDFPPLPTEKHLALDAIHFTAERFSLDLELQVGDLEYANNLTVFHGEFSQFLKSQTVGTVLLTESSYLIRGLGDQSATPGPCAPGTQGPAAAGGCQGGLRPDQRG